MPTIVFPRNDNSIYLRGLVDSDDPIYLATDAEVIATPSLIGTPKYINNATVTWEIRTALYPGGSLVANGSGAAKGTGGIYLIQISNAITLTVDGDYYLYVLAVSGSFKADWNPKIEVNTRVGNTPTT